MMAAAPARDVGAKAIGARLPGFSSPACKRGLARGGEAVDNAVMGPDNTEGDR